MWIPFESKWYQLALCLLPLPFQTHTNTLPYTSLRMHTPRQNECANELATLTVCYRQELSLKSGGGRNLGSTSESFIMSTVYA